MTMTRPVCVHPGCFRALLIGTSTNKCNYCAAHNSPWMAKWRKAMAATDAASAALALAKQSP